MNTISAKLEKQTETSQEVAAIAKRLTHSERVVKAVGKRPLTRDQVAAKLGVKPQAVTRALGDAVSRGELVKTDKGFQKAL